MKKLLSHFLYFYFNKHIFAIVIILKKESATVGYGSNDRFKADSADIF